jgi:hypothetical protein
VLRKYRRRFPPPLAPFATAKSMQNRRASLPPAGVPAAARSLGPRRRRRRRIDRDRRASLPRVGVPPPLAHSARRRCSLLGAEAEKSGRRRGGRGGGGEIGAEGGRSGRRRGGRGGGGAVGVEARWSARRCWPVGSLLPWSEPLYRGRLVVDPYSTTGFRLDGPYIYIYITKNIS